MKWVSLIVIPALLQDGSEPSWWNQNSLDRDAPCASHAFQFILSGGALTSLVIANASNLINSSPLSSSSLFAANRTYSRNANWSGKDVRTPCSTQVIVWVVFGPSLKMVTCFLQRLTAQNRFVWKVPSWSVVTSISRFVGGGGMYGGFVSVMSCIVLLDGEQLGRPAHATRDKTEADLVDLDSATLILKRWYLPTAKYSFPPYSESEDV